MVDLTPSDHTAISNAVWAHPQGVSFNTKLTQIAECCQKLGSKRSGVVRLWMYELYEESIKEDHKKRGIGEFAVKEEKPQVKTLQIAVKKSVSKPHRQRRARLEQPTLPYYAPVFVRVAANEELTSEIEEVLDNLHRNPLKLLKPRIEVKKVKLDPEIIEIAKIQLAFEKAQVRKKRKKKEMLLLLAA